MAGRSKARASSAVSPPSRRPSRSPRCQPATTAPAAAWGSIPTLAQVSAGQAQLHGEVGHKHQLAGRPVGVAGHQLIQQRPVRLRDPRMQQRGRRDHQHTGRLGVVVGWVQAQAEVAVRHPAGHQDLAVGVGAELCHWPCPCCWWMGGAPGYPARRGR
jgi:hypothetical protein